MVQCSRQVDIGILCTFQHTKTQKYMHMQSWTIYVYPDKRLALIGSANADANGWLQFRRNRVIARQIKLGVMILRGNFCSW